MILEFVKRNWWLGVAGVIFAAFLGQYALSSGEAEEDRIKRLIEASYVETDPRACSYLFTDSYLEQQFGYSADRARSVCETQMVDDRFRPDPIAITVTSRDEDAATVRVSAEGGPLGPTTDVVELTEEDAAWSLDKLMSVDLDREAFLRSYERYLLSPPDGLSEDGAGCVMDRLSKLSEPQLEVIFRNGGSSSVMVGRSFLKCDREQVLSRFERDNIDPASGERFPSRILACARDELDGMHAHAAARVLYGDPLALQRLLVGCNRDVFLDSYRGFLDSSGFDGDCIVSELAGRTNREIAESLVSYSARGTLGEHCAVE